MERATVIRLVGAALVLLFLVAGSWILFWSQIDRPIDIPEQDFHRFPGVAGPSHVTVVPPRVPASWTTYGQGSKSRMAILLTDPDSSWLGLAHGLKSIGIPFRITRDVREALTHQVVLVYPMISGKVLSPEELQALGDFPKSGGTLIGVQVLGGGLSRVFGFRDAAASRQRYDLRLAVSDPLLAEFTDPRERRLRIGIREKGLEVMGTYGYTESAKPLAVFDDGTAAVTQAIYGSGRAYAIGLDLGFLLLKGYNNRADELVQSYDNQFDPTLDVWLRLLKSIYRAAQEGAVTVGTVPFGKSLSVMLTHDVDFTRSIKNAVDYAEYEKSQGLVGTYFIQVKYIRDYNDDIFFNDEGVGYLARLAELGMELGSHTIAHSKVFDQFPMGTGREAYPSYAPYVKSRMKAQNASVLGELRVSKFLIDHFSGQEIVSFRPGELSNPYGLPQALLATGFRYSSTATANNSLTHLPYQLTYDRLTESEVDIFEFPVTIEDEELPKMGDRLPQALEVARKISRYGGSVVVLIHPNILDHKLAFEKGFVEGVRPYAWFGSVGEFGRWWAARNQVEIDVARDAATMRVMVTAPKPVAGLTIEVPEGWKFTPSSASSKGTKQRGKVVAFPELQGTQRLQFTRNAAPVLPHPPSSSPVHRRS
ncbi:MAG: hypothetical protein HY348_00550 [Nitrospira defluvii]|nr:hypothetical protein [Nitrospira defluvii]